MVRGGVGGRSRRRWVEEPSGRAEVEMEMDRRRRAMRTPQSIVAKEKRWRSTVRRPRWKGWMATPKMTTVKTTLTVGMGRGRSRSVVQLAMMEQG